MRPTSKTPSCRVDDVEVVDDDCVDVEVVLLLVVHVSQSARHVAAKMGISHTVVLPPQVIGSSTPLHRRTVDVEDDVLVVEDVVDVDVHMPSQSLGHAALNMSPTIPRSLQ